MNLKFARYISEYSCIQSVVILPWDFTELTLSFIIVWKLYICRIFKSKYNANYDIEYYACYNHASAQIMSPSQISLLLVSLHRCPNQSKTQYNLHIVLKLYGIISISVALTWFNSWKVLIQYFSDFISKQTSQPTMIFTNLSIDLLQLRKSLTSEISNVMKCKKYCQSNQKLLQFQSFHFSKSRNYPQLNNFQTKSTWVL